MEGGGAVREVLNGVDHMDTSWRDKAVVINVINLVVMGYQVVIGKVLGKSYGGMTQLLLNEVGDMLSEMVDELTKGKLVYDADNLANTIKASLVELGIAKNVEVEELPPEEKHGRMLRRYRVVIKDSLFQPIYRVLLKKGYTEFPMSPEGLLIAAIVRRVLREKQADARVNMKAKLMEDGETLEVHIEQITPLQK